MSKQNDYTHVFEQIAQANHTTVVEVRREIQVAIRAAMGNPDPKIQDEWAKIPYRGKEPTPEEVMTYIICRARKGDQSVLNRNFFEM